MRRAGCKIAAVSFFLVAAAIVGFLGWVYRASERRVTPRPSPVVFYEPRDLDRGQYIYSLACARCHGRDLGGGREFVLPTVVSWAPNLTGARTWTDEELEEVLMRGVRPDGTVLRAPMPVYRGLDWGDAYKVLFYLRTVPVVTRESRRAVLSWRGRFELAFRDPEPELAPEREGRPKQTHAGEYLATAVMRCADCHGANWAGGTFPQDANEPRVLSSNITPDPVEGIGTWTASDFARALREGKTPQGRELSSAMPRFPVSDEDAQALHTFFKGVPAVQQHVFTPQAVRGNELYVQKGCVVCHGPDGKGPRADITKLGKEADLEKLKLWIKDPASVKPGTQMPRMGIEDPRDLEAIARFVIELSR